ncbi:MAG: hypothetical protein IPK87_00055 [Planctomycetes bacterium]|nr:hypothetical protein [Planctomycetota bacterium]
MTQLKDLKNYQVAPPGHAVANSSGGEWTGAPGHASGFTTFTDTGADFQAYMVGWLLHPDVELPSYLEIVEVVSATAIKVKGDTDTLATSGSTYRLHTPPGVDRATGALITDLEESGSHWLWAGYEYVPPMVGFADPAGQDPGIYGAQSGGNKVGSYHCWNRVYEPATGRWTTPDPAMTPWSSLATYVASPVSQADPSGLGDKASETEEESPWPTGTAPELKMIRKLSKIHWGLRNSIRKALGIRVESRKRKRGHIIQDNPGFDGNEDKSTADYKARMSESLAGLDKWLATLPKGECLSVLTISAHGNPWFLEGEWTWCADDFSARKPHWITATKWGEKVKPFMCKDKCVIEIDACDTAVGSAPQQIANATGCEVRAMAGEGSTWGEFKNGCRKPGKDARPGCDGKIQVFFPGRTPVPYKEP